MKNKFRNNPYALMSIILIMWGSFAAVSKLVLGSTDSFQMLFYMFGTAFLLMTIFILFSGKYKLIRNITFRDLIIIFLCALTSFLYYFLYILALKLIPAIEASMLNYMFPIMIVIFAVPLNHEKLNKYKILSLGLGFAGVALIISNGNLKGLNLTNIWGDLLALGGAVCWGLFSNLGNKSKADQYVSNYLCIAMSFIFSIISLIIFSDFITPDIKTYAGIFWISASNIFVGYLLWFRVMRIASSTLVASLSYITPFITLLYIMLMLGERITITQLSGLVIILAGIMVQKIRSN